MIPAKPFDTYKWRWLSVAPTESLLDPPVFLGVLRVLSRHENEAPSTQQIAQELAKVQADTNTPVDLVRTPERNLIRNSGQYWKGTGLLVPDRGEIHLTPFGRQVAEGRVTQGEFAAIMVQQTTLPNPWTYTPQEVAKWKAAHLEIRPLALVLEIMEELGRNLTGPRTAYLTLTELIKIVIPLAGIKYSAAKIAENIVAFRAGKLNISDWPDCAPESNDNRLAREFLLFLSNYGICRRVEASSRMNERYYLDELFAPEAISKPTGTSIFQGEASAEAAVSAARHSALPSLIERRRMLATVLARPGQAGFRARVLQVYQGRCFLTGEVIPEVLEAAHIVPVTNGGSDDTDNGLCLRTDIHRLFDSGNIRVKATGELAFSDAVRESKNYNGLPLKIGIPNFVNPANLRWRDDYY